MAEIIACPSCQRQLQIPEEFHGKTVQCPECKHTFVAGGATQAAPSAPAKAPAWEKPRPAAEEDEEDRPRRRRRAAEDEDDEELTEVRRNRRHLDPHRGGMILAFGIMSIIGVGTLIFGPLAWIMGSMDMKAIREGRMDPSGEGQTNTGRILGMVATILLVVGVVGFCLLFGIISIVGHQGGGRRF